jgi:hypothetical protein
MQVPSILQGESLKRLLQGAAAGAVATMFVGFYWGGWSLGSTADKMAKERSEVAVIAALAPVCADKFRALPGADAKKVALTGNSCIVLPVILGERTSVRAGQARLSHDGNV